MEGKKLLCTKCKEPLLEKDVRFSYMGNTFPYKLPVCPKCGLVFVPEELALGKILSVEKTLEDK